MTKEACEALRREIKAVADKVWEMREEELSATVRNDEAMANVTLAYRHLEDASLRLGKAIQAIDGGTSVYDKTQVPGV